MRAAVCIPTPCIVTAPYNGHAGSCPANLAHGSSCIPGCNAGYRISGQNLCSFGNLTTVAGCSCDASSPPINGQVGDCTNMLDHGSTCRPTCNTGYTLFGASSCKSGTLAAAKCSPSPCDTSTAPDNGYVGSCNEMIPHQSSCQPGCMAGYTVSGASSCRFGQLIAATCHPSPCTTNAPLHGTMGTCKSSITHGSKCQLHCGTGFVISGTSHCSFGYLSPVKCTLREWDTKLLGIIQVRIITGDQDDVFWNGPDGVVRALLKSVAVVCPHNYRITFSEREVRCEGVHVKAAVFPNRIEATFGINLRESKHLPIKYKELSVSLMSFNTTLAPHGMPNILTACYKWYSQFNPINTQPCRPLKIAVPNMQAWHASAWGHAHQFGGLGANI